MADEIITNVIPNMKAVDLGDGTFAYATVGETAQDRGIATGGSNVTCIDTTKAWIVNNFIGDTLQVTVAGVEYHSLITANTANTITMNIIGAVVVAGDPYKIVSAVGAAATIADGADVTQGAIADAVVAAGAVGTLSAKLRRLTADMGAGIVDLAAIEVINTAIQTAVEIMDDWDETNRAKVNPVAGQAGIAANAGNMDALTTRVTVATNDTHFGTVGAASDIDGVLHGQQRYIADRLEAIETLNTAILAAAGGGTGATVTTNTTGAGVTMANLTPGAAFKLVQVRFNVSTGAPLAAAETFSITGNIAAGGAYDILLYSQDLGTGGINDVVIEFGEGYDFAAADVIDIVLSANAGGDTWGCQTIHRLL